MVYYVFAVRLRDSTDRGTIKNKWPEMVARAKPENKVTADSAHVAILRFAERRSNYSCYCDYVAGSATDIEFAAHVVVEYVPRAHTCYTIDIV